MKDRICLVTGANSGIGLETARGLAAKGATVVMTARSRSKGEQAVADVQKTTGNPNIELLALDLADLTSVRAAAADVAARFESLHVLVNNAGLMLSDRRLTADGFEMTLGVNHLGHFALTLLLLPLLKASAPARIVNVSSVAHKTVRQGLDLDDLMYERRPYSMMGAYSSSKLANVHFTRALARRLEGSGVTVNALHPGTVGSRIASDGDVQGLFTQLYQLARPLMMSTKKGARSSLYVATSEEGGQVSGAYFDRSRQARISRAARDDEAAQRLWVLSEELTNTHI